jgi:hypothetical protein
MMRWTPVVLLLASCNVMGRTEPIEPALQAKLELIPLVDGATTREDVILAYGIPSAQFEGERILTYRLLPTRDGALVVAREAGGSWAMAYVNLVLVFDEGSVLRKHTFLGVR